MSQKYEISAIFRAVDKMSPAMTRMAANMKNFGKNAKSVGRGMTTGISAPIAAFGALTLKTAVNFESSMNKIEARSQATGKSLQSMRDMAKNLGSTTAFSASQTADSMEFLAAAGWKVNDILAATPAILDLAAASGTDLARAADIASNIMGAFKIPAEQAARVADVLAATTAGANVDMEMLAKTMEDAAPIAETFGMSLEETAAAIGLLGNIGIQGSKAGTALKNSMLQLVNPASDATKMLGLLEVKTSKIVNGKRELLSYASILGSFGDKIKNLGSADQLQAIEMLFGKISMAGATELISQARSGELQKFVENLKNVEDRARSMAEIMMKGAPGAVKNLTSAFEGMMIAIAESGLLQWFTDVAKGLTVFIKEVAMSDSGILKWGTVIAGVVALAGPLIFAVGMLISGLSKLAVGIKIVSSALLMSPIGLMITGIAVAIAAAVYIIYDNWDKIVSYFTDKFSAIATAFDQGFLTGIVEVIKEFNPFVLLFDYYDGLISYFTGFDLSGFFREQMDSISAVFSEYNPFPFLMDSIDMLVDAFANFDLSGLMMEKISAMANMLPDWTKNMLGIEIAPTVLPQQQDNQATSAMASMLPDWAKNTQGLEIAPTALPQQQNNQTTSAMANMLPDWTKNTQGLEVAPTVLPRQQDDKTTSVIASMLPDWAKDMRGGETTPSTTPMPQSNRAENVVRSSGKRGRDARARVEVNFSNTPAGTRINTETSGAGLDFEAGVGYAR